MEGGRGGEISTNTTPYMTVVKGQIDARPDEYFAVADEFESNPVAQQEAYQCLFDG